MINSLFKDSHITLSTLRPKSAHSEKNGNRREHNSNVSWKNSIDTRNPAEISFSGVSGATEVVVAPAKIYTSKLAKKFFTMATDNQVVFSALYALALVCILRPAAIMALPTEKKNKDDKKYAAAHSIASGLIGYAIATALFDPIKSAANKIAKDPTKFVHKNAEYLKDPVKMSIAKTYIKMLPEALVALPRAAVTVALIPPILKHVFGWEKKSKADKTIGNPILQDYALINFKSSDMKQKKVIQNFTGESQKSAPTFTGTVSVGTEVAKSNFFKPVKEFFKPMLNAHKLFMDKVTTGMAHVFGKTLETNGAKKIVNWAVTKDGKENKKLIQHLTVLTSLVLSGSYVKKTLENKKLDEHKRNTLAINQAAIAILSTILGYATNEMADKKVNEFIKKFEKINAGDPHLTTYVKGIRAAVPLVIFGTIYRFIAPVFVTPFANKLGNRLQAKKEAALATKQAEAQKH